MGCLSYFLGAEMLEELGVRGRDLGETERGFLYYWGFLNWPFQVHGEKI